MKKIDWVVWLVALGMLAAACGRASAVAEITVDTRQFSFPGRVAAGQTRVILNNQRLERHEFAILRLGDGKTMQDAARYLDAPEGPPPFTNMGGIDGLEPAPRGSMEVDLKPGRYVAVYKIPGLFAGVQPDYQQRIIQEFTVR